MRLDITYTHQPLTKKDAAQAAFINSNDPRVWLTEMSRWGSAAADWACYAVPASLQSVAVVGLFVVTEKPQLDSISPHLLWFSRVGERLFIPINAQLTPSVSEAELAKILIFDVQLFHPTIGWVGFNASDKLDLDKLIDLAVAKDTDWTHAEEGLPARPPLHQINILAPTGKDVFNSFKEGMEQKPLKDIPLKDGSAPNGEKSAFDKMMDDIREQLLRGSRAALDALNNALTENSTGSPSLLDGPYRWLDERMKALQQKRESELQRLLDMFNNDPDEALKYALPLDNPYADRGVAPPSDGLGVRTTDFNLGQLGGGQAVDDWSTDNHYYDLRKKYLEAANRANENGDFRRAAYIYAHLLGDFAAAANVLEQGGFYREAAALHRDHLNNLAAAAKCLEKGELYIEAIGMYGKLEQDEKVGDLYQHIGQRKNAVFYYEKCVKKAIILENYIETARLENEKLNDVARAKATLLRGWSATHYTSSEACLRQYFDFMMLDSDEAAVQQIEPIFKNSPQQQLSFLDVLVNVNKKYLNPHFQKKARPIVYQIVSAEAVQGNRTMVQFLEHFFPEDVLIGKDTDLFLHKKLSKPKAVPPKKKTPIELGCETDWRKTFSFYDGFVAVGVSIVMSSEGYIDVVQSDWSGKKMEYSQAYASVQSFSSLGFTSAFNQGRKDKILMWSLHKSIAEFSIEMDKNEAFSSDLLVLSPIWIPDGALAVGIYASDQIIVLCQLNSRVELLFFTTEGVLLNSEDCLVGNKDFNLDYWTDCPASLFFYNSVCFFYHDDCLFFIQLDGKVERMFIGCPIYKVFQSSFEKNIFVLATECGLWVLDIEKIAIENTVNEAHFFAQHMNVLDILFVSPISFIVLQKEEAVVFACTERGATQQRTIALQDDPVSLLRTNEHAQFAVLFVSGRVVFYDW